MIGDVLARFAPLVRAGIKADHPGARFLIFRMGQPRVLHRDADLRADLKARPLLPALTLDASVMHVAVVGAIDETQHPVRGFDVTDVEFERLLDFIEGEFPDPVQTDRSGLRTQPIANSTGSSKRTAIHGASWLQRPGRPRPCARPACRTGWWNPLPQTLGRSRSTSTALKLRASGQAASSRKASRDRSRASPACACAAMALRTMASGPAACQVMRLNDPRRATRSTRCAAPSPSGESRSDAVRLRQHVAGERLGIFDRHRRSLRRKGRHGVRGVADQGDPAEDAVHGPLRAVWIGQTVHSPASSASF